MALGNSNPRNWGKEAQEIALSLLLKQRNAAFSVTSDGRLMVWPKNNAAELKMLAVSVATLEHPRNGLWTSCSPFDGSVIATGCSQRDCIRKTIAARWM
jgi:hypothetical protein